MRRLNRLLAVIVGILLAAVAVLAGIEIVRLAAGQSALLIPRHSWDHDLRRQHWSSYDIAATSIVLIAVGAVLLLVQLARRKPVRLPLRSQPGERVFISRKGLARRLTFDAARADEVSAVKVKVARRKVTARVALATGVEQRAGADVVRAALEETLRRVAPINDMKVRVAARVKAPPIEKQEREASLEGSAPSELAGTPS